MRRATVAVVLLLTLFVMTPASSLGAPETTLVALQGKVDMSGNEPFVIPVFRSGGQALELTGSFVTELRRLQGASLRVVGWRKEAIRPGLGPFLEVLGYAPVSDGYGKSPRSLVGHLVRQGQAWLLADPTSARLFELVGKLPPGLEEMAGAKVLVRGRAAKGQATAQGFAVDGYQILAEPGTYRSIVLGGK